MASYSLNARLATLENRISTVDKDIDSKFINLQNQNKTIISSFGQRITTLEDKIKEMDEALKGLQQKYEENKQLLDKFCPKVGQKRKWWQVI
jgi:uncharacterized coiled-coil protein SlyX